MPEIPPVGNSVGLPHSAAGDRNLIEFQGGLRTMACAFGQG